ncbi:HAD hydrolase-like protein [Streptomyces sp. DG2A-72]|uniref:HAD family hydrolase n=1 Tax=Streptomyces sp. DG2A-72 TaxID=3051386 RepID=UPI00265BF53A|nr:HAD hydrolase-like protein [Streptomyces sp. DG2A-72]MDO0934251.1 HAD hydrolase-like protein [Streptomyces sp. DG2A-72]
MTPETGRPHLVARDAEELRELVAGTRHVLFDFDGPICRLFARYPAVNIARAQVQWLVDRGRDSLLTEEERFSPDPHGVLSTLAARHPGTDLIIELEEHLTQHELRAARGAWPTEYADPLIHTWVAVGARLAIVTNNSARTVAKYLEDRGLHSCFAPHVYGRTQQLHLLKPHPATLKSALLAMGAASEFSLMIGDSDSDYTAARAVGVRFLGYASSAKAVRKMRHAGVPERDILGSLEPLLDAVRAVKQHP